MKQRISFDVILIYFLGGLFGLILALVFLNSLYTLEMTNQGQYDFFYYWVKTHPPAHAITIIFGFILMGFFTANRKIIKDQLKIQENEIKTLEEVNKAKTEMMAFATHQMRTPLTSVGFSLKMFLEGDFGKLTSIQKDLLNKTYNINEDLIILIEEFLDVSKLDLKRMEIYFKDVEFVDLEKDIKQIIEGLKSLMEEKKIILNYSSVLDDKLSVQMDLKKINQVVRNLVENAIDYTPFGGEVRIILENDKENVKFSVSDTGIGIPKETRAKIFRKFFRADNAKHVRSRGTGLGLYLCKEFIEGHKGKIWFNSEEGKGTTFSFTIPLKAEIETEVLFRKI